MTDETRAIVAAILTGARIAASGKSCNATIAATAFREQLEMLAERDAPEPQIDTRAPR